MPQCGGRWLPWRGEGTSSGGRDIFQGAELATTEIEPRALAYGPIWIINGVRGLECVPPDPGENPLTLGREVTHPPSFHLTHPATRMLPAEFYMGNATTVLLWLFQTVPHEALLVMIGVSAVLGVLVVMSLMFILIYLGFSCCFRLVRLTSLISCFLYDRARVRVVRERASGAARIRGKQTLYPMRGLRLLTTLPFTRLPRWNLCKLHRP